MENTQTENLLEVNNIEVVYNDIIQVLRGVSLNVPKGSIVSLLGTNGAGKTTTLRAVSGLLKPENGAIKEGYIKFDGTDTTAMLGTEVVRQGASDEAVEILNSIGRQLIGVRQRQIGTSRAIQRRETRYCRRSQPAAASRLQFVAELVEFLPIPPTQLE